MHPSVKAADTHKVLRAALDTVLERRGFVRTKGSSARWSRAEVDGSLLLLTQLSQSNWDPHKGGKFTVELQFGGEPTPWRGYRRRLGGYLADDAWQEWMQMRNTVAARAHRPSQAFLDAFPASLVPTYLTNFEPLTEVAPSSDLWFPYLSASDVAAWGAFLARVLPDAVTLFLKGARQ